MASPSSCDTFVVLPPLTQKGLVIFGKNSDRPQNEVQEIVHVTRSTHASGSQLKCTYIEIDQAEETYGVILSKPSWMWGSEMGANEFGVVIGNEAVWTKLDDPLEEKLLGMDLVRLGLERGKTARHALTVITALLEQYGQGGPCSDTLSDFSYHNSFLIADPSEAWILETAGQLWAAENVKSGSRNISNCLSIGTTIDLMSEGLKEKAQELNLWDGSSEFNFAKIFGSGGASNAEDRLQYGSQLLKTYSEGNNFDILSMIKVLRDETHGICRGCDNAFPTQSSQVSVLSPPGSVRPTCHWFTGTPNPQNSVFKPFVFMDSVVKLTDKIKSPVLDESEDPAKVKPRFAKSVDRRHLLYKKHEACYNQAANLEQREKLGEILRELEDNCISEVEKTLDQFDVKDESLDIGELFNDAVEAELRFYK